MKNVILALVMFVSTAAHASAIDPRVLGENAKLTKLQLNNDQFPGEVIGAEVNLNTISQKITLTVHYRQLCPRPLPGHFSCMAISLQDRTVELPIISRKIGACHQEIYTAKIDERPVDGALSQIVLTDMRTNTCRMLVPADQMTNVVFTTQINRMTGDGKLMKSYLSGEALRRPFVLAPR